MIKALFLDRDGVINIDTGYLYKIQDFKFNDGIFDLCKIFVQKKFKIFVITNQSGINRGYFTENDFQKLSKWMLKQFEEKNIHIDKVYYCPHSPNEQCDCRKPKPKMIFDAKKEFNIDLENSLFIGDKTSDMECALNAGLKKMILINSSYHSEETRFLTANNIKEAIDIILKGDI